MPLRMLEPLQGEVGVCAGERNGRYQVPWEETGGKASGEGAFVAYKNLEKLPHTWFCTL